MVPKDDGKKTRLIFHLSYDFPRDAKESEKRNSVNYCMPDEIYSVKYKDLDYAVKASLKLKEQLQDRIFDGLLRLDEEEEHLTIFYSKMDVVSAFRILPMRPGHCPWLVMKAMHPITGKFYFFVDKCLLFGASVSCAVFQSFSDALTHIAEKTAMKKLQIVGINIIITNYLDDFLFLSFLEELCNRLLRCFMEICDNVGCPISWEKTVWVTTSITFLGMLLNGRSFTISIPLEKLAKICDFKKEGHG